MSKTMDKEMLQFEAALIRSVSQAVAGEFAVVHTPEQVEARRRAQSEATDQAGQELRSLKADEDERVRSGK